MPPSQQQPPQQRRQRPTLPQKGQPTYWESVRNLNAQAAPLFANGHSNVIQVVANWVEDHARTMAHLGRLGPGASKEEEEVEGEHKPKEKTVGKVRLLTLLSFANRHEVRWMLGGMVVSLLSGLSMPAWLLLLAQSLQTFNEIGTLVNTIGSEATQELLLSELYRLCWLFGAVGAISLVVGAGYVAIWTYTGEKQALRIREQFVRAAFRQEAAWFDQRGGDPQELPTYAANALGKINDALGRQMMDALANLVSAVACLAVAIGLNAVLALIMLCVLPVVAIVIAIISVFMRRRSGEALERLATSGAFATEVISAMKTIASLNVQLWSAQKYEDIVREGQRYSIWAGFLSRLTSGVMGLIFYATYTVAFLFGNEQVANTEAVKESKLNPFYCMINYCGIGGSEVMVCIYGVILCAQFFALMTPGIQAINLGRQAAVEIFGVIHRKPDIDASMDFDDTGDDNTAAAAAAGRQWENYDGSLEFKDVIFAYPSRPQSVLFRGFNLKIAPGSSIALVGPSGSGKSTISKLLLRFYDPLAGSVLAQDTPLTELNLKWWRSQIGYVQQQPSLFPGTIGQNIAMGIRAGVDVTDEQVMTAAKAASAHDFIMELPDRYDTFYNGASMQLSGGQVQRIAIARALIRNPTILILDEATSALDSESERSVQHALASIRKIQKITTVSVAHRLSTIITSDQIAVIDNGSIQQLGSHKQLIEEGGIYGLLCKSQGITADMEDAIAAEENQTTMTTSLKEKGPEEAHDSRSPMGNEKDVEAAAGNENDDEMDGGKFEEVAPIGRLWEYNKDEWAYLLLGVLGAMVVGILPPVEGILFSKLTANFFELDSEQMREENRPLCFLFLALGAASLIGNAAIGSGFSVSGNRLARRMRVAVFEKIVRHDMAWFDYPEHSTGELTSRLAEDTELVSRVTGWSLGQQIQVVSSLASGLIISMVFSWQIGLIALGCMPLILGSSFVMAACTQNKVMEQDGISSATILEQGLREISLVQAYGLETSVGDQYCDSLIPDSKSKFKTGLYAGLVFGISQCAIFGTFGLIFYAGVELMLQLKVGFTDFFASLLAIMFSAISVGQVSADFSSNKKGLAAAARLFAIIDAPIDADDPSIQSGARPGSLNGTVTFQSVNFAYPTRPDHPIYHPSKDCDGFNLTIPKAESVAFVGRSGTGKSTALQLLLRFYRASSGHVMVDGHNVEELNVEWLRGNIGYVGQQPVLFSGTIRDNLLMGKRDASDDELIHAAKMANAHDFISKLSNGYNTEIGAGGGLLSGGQKQRIAIARAIVKNPPILVLDEATSALDNESERIVQAALDDMRKKQPRTTLVVAHRLMTVKNCDKIAVLDDGGIVEHGTHSELLDKKGIYYDLWTKQ